MYPYIALSTLVYLITAIRSNTKKLHVLFVYSLALNVDTRLSKIDEEMIYITHIQDNTCVYKEISVMYQSYEKNMDVYRYCWEEKYILV